MSAVSGRGLAAQGRLQTPRYLAKRSQQALPSTGTPTRSRYGISAPIRTPGGPSNPPNKLNQIANGVASATATIRDGAPSSAGTLQETLHQQPDQQAAQEEHDEPNEDGRYGEQHSGRVPIPPAAESHDGHHDLQDADARAKEHGHLPILPGKFRSLEHAASQSIMQNRPQGQNRPGPALHTSWNQRSLSPWNQRSLSHGIRNPSPFGRG